MTYSFYPFPVQPAGVANGESVAANAMAAGCQPAVGIVYWRNGKAVACRVALA